MKKYCLLLLSVLVLTGCSKEVQCGVLEKVVDGKCFKTVYTCADGYELIEDNKCKKLDEEKEKSDSYTCTDGYTLEADKCIKKVTSEPVDVNYCNSESYLSNGACYSKVSTPATPTYNCNGIVGTLNNNKCVGEAPDTKSRVCLREVCTMGDYDPTLRKCVSYSPFTNRPSYYNLTCVEYGCTRGEMKNNLCYIQYEFNANVAYNCTDPSTRLEGSVCVKDVATPALTRKECPADYPYDGVECSRIESIDSTLEHICENGYEEENGKCYKYIIEDAIKKDVEVK